MAKKETAAEKLKKQTEAKEAEVNTKEEVKVTKTKEADISEADRIKAMAIELAKEMAKEMMAEQTKQNTQAVEVTRKEIKDTDYILVRSMKSGEVVYRTQNGLFIYWNGLGSTQRLEMRELRYMRNAHPSFLTSGLLFIEDADVSKELYLEEIYETIFPVKNLEEVLQKDLQSMEETINKLPRTVQISLANLALQKINSKELTDLNVIRLIQNIVGVDLELFI